MFLFIDFSPHCGSYFSAFYASELYCISNFVNFTYMDARNISIPISILELCSSCVTGKVLCFQTLLLSFVGWDQSSLWSTANFIPL